MPARPTLASPPLPGANQEMVFGALFSRYSLLALSAIFADGIEPCLDRVGPQRVVGPRVDFARLAPGSAGGREVAGRGVRLTQRAQGPGEEREPAARAPGPHRPLQQGDRPGLVAGRQVQLAQHVQRLGEMVLE